MHNRRDKLIKFVEDGFVAADESLAAHKHNIEQNVEQGVHARTVDAAMLGILGVERALYARAYEIVSRSEDMSEVLEQTRGHGSKAPNQLSNDNN